MQIQKDQKDKGNHKDKDKDTAASQVCRIRWPVFRSSRSKIGRWPAPGRHLLSPQRFNLFTTRRSLSLSLLFTSHVLGSCVVTNHMASWSINKTLLQLVFHKSTCWIYIDQWSEAYIIWITYQQKPWAVMNWSPHIYECKHWTLISDRWCTHQYKKDRGAGKDRKDWPYQRWQIF